MFILVAIYVKLQRKDLRNIHTLPLCEVELIAWDLADTLTKSIPYVVESIETIMSFPLVCLNVMWE